MSKNIFTYLAWLGKPLENVPRKVIFYTAVIIAILLILSNLTVY